LVTAYSIPPPTVQPVREFERLLEAKKGTPVLSTPLSERSLLTPPVP
jgi:hypothetical protein